MDGVEVLRRLRARRGGGPRCIMLTAARREPHAIEPGLREGADAYLTKPIDARELSRARARRARIVSTSKRMLEAQRRDHIAMLVHDLRHPLSSLGLIAEVLEAEDLTPTSAAAPIETIRTLARTWRASSTACSPRAVSRPGVFTVEPRPARVDAVIEPIARRVLAVAASRRVTLVWRGRRRSAHRRRRRRSSGRRSTTSSPTRSSSRRAAGTCDSARTEPARARARGRRQRPRRRRPPSAPTSSIATARRERPAGGGTGLGLAIARGIAEAHGGSIDVGDTSSAAPSFRFGSRSSGWGLVGGDVMRRDRRRLSGDAKTRRFISRSDPARRLVSRNRVGGGVSGCRRPLFVVVVVDAGAVRIRRARRLRPARRRACFARGRTCGSASGDRSRAPRRRASCCRRCATRTRSM